MAAFWAMRQAFDRLLHRALWERVYAGIVDGILSRPTFNGGREWHASGVALFESSECYLSLRTNNNSEIGLQFDLAVADGGTGVVATRPAPAMLASLSDTPLPLVFHALPAGTRLEVFDPECCLGPGRKELAHPWTRVDVHAPEEVVEVLSTHREPWCLLEFSLKPLSSQRWDFDRATLKPLGAALTHSESKLLLAMLSELARAGHSGATPEVMRLLQHEDFNVRWAALRCLGKISPNDVQTALHRLKNDPHPFIATMANNILASSSAVDSGGPKPLASMP